VEDVEDVEREGYTGIKNESGAATFGMKTLDRKTSKRRYSMLVKFTKY